MTTIRKTVWNDAAAAGLLGTTDCVERVERTVESGERELFRVESVESDGWLVTQCTPDTLFVWCYEGRGFVPLARSLARIALDNDLPRIGWFTKHAAPFRAFRECRGIVTDAGNGDFEFNLKCEDVCAAK